MHMTVIPSADAVLSADAAGVAEWLETYFQTMNAPAPHLSEAMSYAALNGGKRVRASLVLSAARLAGDAHLAAPVAAALEMVHAYSLIHDDLPAMDDETHGAVCRRPISLLMRQPQFWQAMLCKQKLFSVLTTKLEDLPADRTLSLIRILADASGVHGMAGGQMLDLQAEKMTPNLTSTRAMQELKTGALIRSAAVMGVIVGGGDKVMQDNIGQYADRLGFAFQIADDILDYRSTGEALGKPVGRDAEQGKASFVLLLGLAQAEQKAAELIEEAIALLEPYASRADELKALAAFSIHRKS